MFLFVFALAFWGLSSLRLPWWGALVGAGFAWLPISNRLLMLVTELQRPLEPYFEDSLPDPGLASMLEDLAGSSSWTDEQVRRLDELRGLATGGVAVDGSSAVWDLHLMLTNPNSQGSFSRHLLPVLLFWTVAPPERTIPDIRQEVLAIAANLRKVEVRPT